MSREKRRQLIAFFIGLGITVLIILASFMDIFERQELKLLDLWFTTRGPLSVQDKPSLSRIVIVSIDDASFRELNRRWPWPRQWHGELAKKLKAMGAQITAFDVAFTESTEQEDFNQNLLGNLKDSTDSLIAKHLAKVKGSVLKPFKEDLDQLFIKPKTGMQDQLFARDIKEAENVILSGMYSEDDQRLELPVPVLAESCLGVSLANVNEDLDSFNRRMGALRSVDNKLYLPTALKVYLVSENKQLEKAELQPGQLVLSLAEEEVSAQKEKILIHQKLRIPVDAKGQMLINFAGVSGSISTIPFYKIYNNEIGAEQIKDKVVFVGSTTPILHDVFSTPFKHMPGVELIANAYRTLVDEDFIRKIKPSTQFWALLFLGALTSILLLSFNPILGLVFTGVIMLGVLFTACYLFLAQNVWWPIADALWLIFLCYVGIILFKVLIEEREKRKIRGVFSRYVSKQVVEELLKNPEELKMGGNKQHVTILFSDIRSFTSMSEKMAPEEVVHILNEYLAAMVDIVFKNGGTLDKFVGDAVMATFGVPKPHPDDAFRAVKTAMDMMAELGKLQAKWRSEGKNPFDIGIGINSGDVVVGNMGSPQRMEFTVIGDNVNLASRMESLNKEFHAHVLISGQTYELVKDRVEVRYAGETKVKGKEESVHVYELLKMLEAPAKA